MEETTPEKEEAIQKTDWERQRIGYYLGLRYNFAPMSVDGWLNNLFERRKAIYKPMKSPSWNQIRKDAGLGFFENAFAFLSKDKKEEVDAKRKVSKQKLQAQVDAQNVAEWKKCERVNNQIKQDLTAKLEKIRAHNSGTIEEYFAFVLESDSYALDGNEYPIDFCLAYSPQSQRLIVDYKLPVMEQISQIKGWKVNKQGELKPEHMNKSDYLDMYERILFDLSMRVVGLVFKSDNEKTVKDIVFNGSCVYSHWQKMPTILISFIMAKSQYSYAQVRRMDFVSKVEIAKLAQVAYLGDIHSSKAPTDLWDEPPMKLVVPFQSSF